jgi:hypothetical protein
MQPCNRIYYSSVHWRRNMFRAAYHLSSGALNSICSLWLIYARSDQSLSDLTTAGHHIWKETRGCKYTLELLMMSGMPLETCWAFNKRWKNKFYYKVACCCLFLLIYIVLIIFKFVTNICFKSTDLNFFWPKRPLCFKCLVFVFLLQKLMFGLTVNIIDSLYSLYISLVQRNSF